jgi:hypothetical protein
MKSLEIMQKRIDLVEHQIIWMAPGNFDWYRGQEVIEDGGCGLGEGLPRFVILDPIA